jgi:diacylglycerol kinase family enzyme
MHTQKSLTRSYALPEKTDAVIDLALRQDAQVMDLILCNKQLLLFKATIGRLPLMDSSGDISRLSIVVQALKKFIGIELLIFNFTTSSQKKIKTAACGYMIVQHHEGTIASRLIFHDGSFTDGKISLLVAAPLSIIQYLKFLAQSLKRTVRRKSIPSTIWIYQKSSDRY